MVENIVCDSLLLTPKEQGKLQGLRRERFTFEQSEADLELLKSIYEGTYSNTKRGDAIFRPWSVRTLVTLADIVSDLLRTFHRGRRHLGCGRQFNGGPGPMDFTWVSGA